MKFASTTALGLAALAAPAFAAHGHPNRAASHHELARRVPGDVHEYGKRFDNARYTFFDDGL
jgi:hypothetical protein